MSGVASESLHRPLVEVRGHHDGLRFVAAREDDGLPEKADLVDDFGQVVAGLGDSELLWGVVAHETRVHVRLLVHPDGLYNSSMSSLPDPQGIAFWSPDHADAIELGQAFAYRGGRQQLRLVYFLGAEIGGESSYPPPSLQNWDVRDMYGRRDQWTCGLCGNPIPKRPTSNESLNLSIDHITPRSHSGSNYPSNLRAAHQGCNKARRNKPHSTEFVLPRSLAHLFS